MFFIRMNKISTYVSIQPLIVHCGQGAQTGYVLRVTDGTTQRRRNQARVAGASLTTAGPIQKCYNHTEQIKTDLYHNKKQKFINTVKHHCFRSNR